MDFHLYVHFDGIDIGARVDAIDGKIAGLVTQGTKIMATLDDIQASEAHEGTALGQLADVVTAQQKTITDLQAQLAAALAGTTLPPAVQAQVDAAFAAADDNTQKVDSILASLAPAPAPAPAP